MPYVPGCRYDLFISYASENNRDGWVGQFERALGQELAELLGRQFVPKESIYFDKRELEIAHSFPHELITAARDSAMIVPVLSPGYLTSPWCDRERTEFFSQLPHGAAPESCLAPIVIRPIELDGLDGLYRSAQRLSFLSADEQTPFPPGSPDWTTRLRQFASQLKNALQRLRRGCRPVFIGKASTMERSQNLRAWCCTELERRYFRTVPEALPALSDTEAVRANLQNAGLAIHFLGGADPVALEAIEISAEVCTGPTILYQAFGTELTPDERLWLAEFERQLQSASALYQRLAGKNDQELLALIDEQITRSKKASVFEPSPLQLALICEELDLDAVRQLREAIRSRHPMEVDFPDFLNSRLKAMERLRRWQDFLGRARALLFYYGLAERERLDPIWLKAAEHKPPPLQSWFLAPPDLEVKREKHPDALWNVDQVISLMEGVRRSQQT